MASWFENAAEHLLHLERRKSRRWFLSDADAFWAGTHAAGTAARTRAEAWIVVQYHILEKGLTMPERRLAFGKGVVTGLMASVDAFRKRWPNLTAPVVHAVGVVKAYRALHEKEGQDFSDDPSFWASVVAFLAAYPGIAAAKQAHVTREEFYAARESPFPDFARSRHTLRHYSDEPISKEKIVAAVELAMTAPSACNRQHARVHCIARRELARRILEVQGGNRGFGHLADKVLVVTSDLSVEMGERERNAPYVNGGIFLMNLCYALHYHGIAHCILSCGIEQERLTQIRALAEIPSHEVIVGMLSCGIAPKVFDVAASPRKSVDDILAYRD